MRILYFIAFALVVSCSKNNIEEHCFITKEEKPVYVEKKPYTVKEILEKKPEYLQIIDLKEYRSFKKDSLEFRDGFSEEKVKANKEKYKLFNEKFPDYFSYSGYYRDGTILYALGSSELGFWLLKIENDKPSAYFLGLSFSHYYINDIQEKPIIKDGYLQFEGSLVKIIKVPGLPGYDDYSAIEDGKLFKIKLDDLMKDSDQDGYNDIFEEAFALNPDNKDTDGDGINDFEDMNPLFKSEKNKFSELYTLLLPSYAEDIDFKKSHYTFEVFKSDCDYFHQISPEMRVLFISKDDKKRTYYTRITDVTRNGVSNMKRDPNNANRFYISKSGSSYQNDYAAEYKEGKWVLEMIGGIVI
ncbi:hypothetical protein JI747_005170 [Chryseobacterium sp. RG1]|uniref:Uncharacterized protein n=1 Tax=Chryseobacterium tagetis TaxID=2801334 RepID=A0ABS8A1U2_9FLAO|nr:hypothetical protein [Chryseobacterium tagetis]MCA6066560.1 hypothetical protein [Chryseobacterium tagetis]